LPVVRTLCRMSSNTKINDDPRERAKRLYWQGYKVVEVVEIFKGEGLEIPAATIHSWKNRDDWDGAAPISRVDNALDAELVRLIGKIDKTDRDLKVINQLMNAKEKAARIRKFEAGGSEKHLNEKVRNKGRKTNTEKNYLDINQLDRLEECFKDNLFDYQRVAINNIKKHRITDFLKARQIGWTYLIGRFGGLDCATTGDPQNFLSASKRQSHIFKGYIVDMVKEACDVELQGSDQIQFGHNDGVMNFLSTNKNTAQGYHGHSYFDEYFHIPGFKAFKRNASGMAMHKQWRQCYFSTPSTTSSEAYPFWTGEHFNEGRPKKDHINLDVSHAALKNGRLCEDGRFRQIITIEDAIAGGNDLYDIETLKLEYNPRDFNNLLMCEFLDDTLSEFSLKQMQACMVDSWEVWDDYQPLLIKPYAGDVWIGFDPSRYRDDSSVVVIAPPLKPGGKFRILEKFSWTNMDFETQAAHIYELTKKYNVAYIGIDRSGIGAGVFELVQKFYPATTGINYSLETKNKMVLKAKNVIYKKRLEFDAGWSDLSLSFMSISRDTTGSGKITYKATRNENTGHADLAWAVMHALLNEPLDATSESGGSTSKMETF